MAREHLTGRSIQPGDDRTFETSERNFIEAASRLLPKGILLEPAPRDLRALFSGEGYTYGLAPEAKVVNPSNGRFFYVEVKKQGPGGNAEERGMKLFTTKFEEFLGETYGLPYHPYCIIFCESLATLPRYTKKFPFFLREEQYLLWEGYNDEILAQYLKERCVDWLLWVE